MSVLTEPVETFALDARRVSGVRASMTDRCR
ncbi:hypothetical protein MFUL124B02_00245 [Myxococcus fulvus 124B02]|nr:hypothetical protein MFUL124B02_00245 [Myxococcus fulvus 124B02]